MKKEDENTDFKKEDKDLSSEPDINDFPKSEWIVESFEIDIPKEIPDLPPIKIEKDQSEQKSD